MVSIGKFFLAIVIISMSVMTQANGEAMYNSLGCAGCHGAGGKSTILAYPSLAGKDATWTVQQLKDFQTGVRKSVIMKAMAPMAEGYEQIIADYLATQ